MKIIHFSQFSAPYKGAFIKSLERLEELNKQYIKFVYVFPEKTKKTFWINQFMVEHEVYFTNDNLINCEDEIQNIFNKTKPQVVHTHFDGYDMPVTWAKKMYLKRHKKDIKVIWHLHNSLSFHSNILKKIYQFFIFKYHYGYLASKVNIISVSQEMNHFVNRFKKRNQSEMLRVVLSNGVKLPEIGNNYELVIKKEFRVFGTFGGINKSKRVDLLLEAGQILEKKNLKFKILITKGVDTLEVVNQFFKGKQPDWVELMDQTDNVAEFYDKIDCFVSTSFHETFSFAILEATFYNKPVIQSDIEGTKWNAKNPSTLVFKSLNANDLSIKMDAWRLLNGHCKAHARLIVEQSMTFDIPIWKTYREKIQKVIDRRREIFGV